MKILKALAGVLATGVLAVCLVMLGATSASARTSPPPGSGWKWGIAPSALPTSCSNDWGTPTTGGWDERQWISDGTIAANTASPPPAIRALVLEFGEPCYVAGAFTSSIRWGMVEGQMSYGSAGTPPSVGSEIYIGASAAHPASEHLTYLRCQSSEWATTYTDVYMTTSGGWFLGGLSFGDGAVHNTSGHNWAWDPSASCAYIREIHLSVCPLSGFSQTGGTCVPAIWSAERSFKGVLYEDDPPEEAICKVHPEHPDCVYVLPPETIDGTDFDTVCAYAPVFGWGDWNWLKDFVGHYARCLFQPVNGFDREGSVGLAWEDSPASELNTDMASIAGSVDVTEACGMLFNTGSWSVMPDFGVNTCTWGSWGGPLKTFLSAVVTIFGGIWLIWLTVNTIVGVLNKRTDNPLGGAE